MKPAFSNVPEYLTFLSIAISLSSTFLKLVSNVLQHASRFDSEGLTKSSNIYILCFVCVHVYINFLLADILSNYTQIKY